MNLILCFLFAFTALTEPANDRVNPVPGYSDTNIRVFSGQLSTASENRKLHYVFVESERPSNTTSRIILWLNGGPGCSSMLGFLQQIGPYYLQVNQPYHYGDHLTKNKYSWDRQAHLLFLDSPAGVGLSVNNDQKYVYNDENTAEDAVAAIDYFFKEKFEQLKSDQFYIAGQSYAGKYIPDLALKIVEHNKKTQKNKINLLGIFVGNGVLDFTNDNLQTSQIDFMISHNFIDPKLSQTWETSCKADEQSAGCQYFYRKYDDLVGTINPFNIYGSCYSANSQQNFIRQLSRNFQAHHQSDKCLYNEGVQSYFRNHSAEFHSQKGKDFVVCDENIFKKYKITESGSMAEMAKIIVETNITVYFYSGDWDDAIPFTYSLTNIQRLLMKQDGELEGWKVSGQHAGFKRKYRYIDRKMKFWTVKGAGHQVPIYQRQRIYEVLRLFLQDEEESVTEQQLLE